MFIRLTKKYINGPKTGDLEDTVAAGYCGSSNVEPGGGDVGFGEAFEDAPQFKDECGRPRVVITNKSQTQVQTQDGVLNSISVSDSGMVIIKILRLFSYSGLSLKFRNLEIGLYPTQELYLR